MAKRKTDKEVIDALKESGGVISDAAKILGMHRASLSERIHKTPTLLEARDNELEELKDLAEGNVFRKVKEGDVDTSKWFLAKRARDRGYGEKLDIEDKTPREKKDLSDFTAEELDVIEQIHKRHSNAG